MRYYISLFVSVVAVVVMPLAAGAQNVSIDQDTSLVLPSDGSGYTIKSGSHFDQLSVGNDTFTFTGNVSVDLRGGDKKLSNNRNITTECLSDGTSKLSISTSAGDTVVTPEATCAGSGGGSGSGGGGGGGGGGSGGGGFSPAPAPTTVDKVTQLKQQIAQVQAQISQKLAAQQGAPAAVGVIVKDLVLGNRGDDVTLLQTILSRDKAIYPEGLVTGFFGPATLRAVKKFQEKYGVPAIGRVGPQTRAKLEEVFGAVSPVIPPAAPAAQEAVAPVSAVSAGGIPSRNLAPGERDDQVKALQQILAQDPQIYPEGVASGYFGPATTRAVKKFQEKYGLPPVGQVGPRTRAKLEEIFGGSAQVPAPVAPAPAPVSGEIPAAAPAPEASPAAGNGAQVKAVQEQIQTIQAKLIQEQIKLIQEKINQLTR